MYSVIVCNEHIDLRKAILVMARWMGSAQNVRLTQTRKERCVCLFDLKCVGS